MARVTKKDIYASYGIEYDPDSEKILSPIGWINLLLIDGNEKLGKGVWTYSTLPGTHEYETIVNGEHCKVKGTCSCDCDGCYAKENNYKYDSTIQAMAIRTVLARYYPDFMRVAIRAQIEADKIDTVRIHAAGDFADDIYVAAWKWIVSDTIGTVDYWTYTKTEYENAFDGLPNINVVKSLIPNIGMNYGDCAYVMAAYKTLLEMGKSVHVCRCGCDEFQHCNTCKGCRDHEYVLFLKHSTPDYNAKKDPLYQEFLSFVDRVSPAQYTEDDKAREIAKKEKAAAKKAAKKASKSKSKSKAA